MDLAIHDFSKAIDFNPVASIPYLDRGSAYFELGDYNHSLQDYYQYTSQTVISSLSLPDFFLGFSTGVRKGIYDSGEGLFLFVSDFVRNPINTGQQIWEAFTLLSHLVHTEQWEVLSEALAPEVCQLVQEWDTLPSEVKGKLAGYAFGKHGSDILMPGALAKAAARGMKGLEELGTIWQSFQNAQKGLLLECLATCEDTAQFALATQTNRAIITLGKDLGDPYKQMAMLKEAGTLESTVNNTSKYVFNHPKLQRSYEHIKKAEDFLEPYSNKPLPEARVRELIHQTGIKTFPKPRGVPENFNVAISKNGAGMIYVHPEIKQINVRVMPGKPYSPFPNQRKPYVIHQVNGKGLDIYGNKVSSTASRGSYTSRKVCVQREYKMKFSEEDKNNIINSIIEIVANIADKNYQKRVWVKGIGPECDDFSETVNNFFGLCDPTLEEYQDFGITEPQYLILNKFRFEFDQFERNSKSRLLECELIETPEWQRIMGLAKDVLVTF